MLARTVAPTADFHHLARYLLNGKTGTPSPDRVAWSLPHNLPTDDVLLAADLMAACAGINRRATKPVYHLMIGWAPHEKPTPEQMQAIATQTLHRAGLGEHQAFIMGHGDTAHDHLHMLINRVHPETGATWKPSHDWRLFDRIMRELADEHGFQFVPSKSFNPELTRHERTKPNRNATYAAKRGANTDRPQWSAAEAETYGERLSHHLDAASTWDDLAALAASDGLSLTAKGQGYVVGNSDAYAKLSALKLTHTAKSHDTPQRDDEEPSPRLSFSDHHRDHHVRWPRHQPHRPENLAPWLDAVDIAKGLANWGLAATKDVRNAIDEAIAEREAAREEFAPLIHRLLTTTSCKPAPARRAPKPTTLRTQMPGR